MKIFLFTRNINYQKLIQSFTIEIQSRETFLKAIKISSFRQTRNLQIQIKKKKEKLTNKNKTPEDILIPSYAEHARTVKRLKKARRGVAHYYLLLAYSSVNA